MQNPEKMLFHMREAFPCTVLIDGDRMEKLNTKTEQTLSALVYPSWHPSGRYVAFSVNSTKQAFHTASPNRIEVFDLASDVVVYDVEKHEIITAPELFSPEAFETFPAFSPDGCTLFFCSSDTFRMPEEYASVKYSLCSIPFDPEQRRFGTEVDTLFQAGTHQKSVSFPRVSPDGKFLMFTLAGYGNFSIWHRDADLYLLSLSDGTVRPLDALNSDEVESYHSWSSNSRWVVFSSRRLDGLSSVSGLCERRRRGVETFSASAKKRRFLSWFHEVLQYSRIYHRKSTDTGICRQPESEERQGH
jgi:hypothetical protein